MASVEELSGTLYSFEPEYEEGDKSSSDPSSEENSDRHLPQNIPLSQQVVNRFYDHPINFVSTIWKEKHTNCRKKPAVIITA